jgi:hypothetical protein
MSATAWAMLTRRLAAYSNMSSKRRGRGLRSDAEVLAQLGDVALLRAVAAGRVTRDSGGGAFAGYWCDGQPVRLNLSWLAREELIMMPLSGPPRLAPRGLRLLQIANGEISAPADG